MVQRNIAWYITMIPLLKDHGPQIYDDINLNVIKESMYH